MTLLFFILATIGFTNILVHGLILDLIKVFGKSIREWMQNWTWSKELFSCYECTGFWAGLACGALLISTDWWTVLASGFVGSVVAQTFNDLVYLINSKIEYEVDHDDTRKD